MSDKKFDEAYKKALKAAGKLDDSEHGKHRKSAGKRRSIGKRRRLSLQEKLKAFRLPILPPLRKYSTREAYVSLPAVGDRITWTIRPGEKIHATVKGIFPRRVSARHPSVEVSPGGVRIAEDNGTAYSFHHQEWMTHVLSGAISVKG
jgi:hypothetical protein